MNGFELAGFVAGVPVSERCSLRFGPVAWRRVKEWGAVGRPLDTDWDAYWAATDGQLFGLPARLDESAPDGAVWVIDSWGRIVDETTL